MIYNDQLVKQLRELASVAEECENAADCDKCTKEEICLGFTNKRIIEVVTQAADAIEELLTAAKAMHTWIFLNSGDEQDAYDECGLTDEMNMALGYGGQYIAEITEDDET